MSEDATEQHRSFAISSVLATVAFLEATIAEVFAAAEHSNLEGSGRLPELDRRRISALAPHLDRNPSLERFQAVLQLVEREPFDVGRVPFQDVALVVRLRNQLVHYKPQWRAGGSDWAETLTESALVKGLVAKRFPPNPFAGAGNPFFPDKCLGHGCAAWAIRSALQFTDQFFQRLGVLAPYEHIRPKLLG